MCHGESCGGLFDEEMAERYREAEKEEWRKNIAFRMFDPDGDIYKAEIEERRKKETLEVEEVIQDGEDLITIYREKTYLIKDG